MGAAMALSLAKRTQKSTSRRSLYPHIILRSLSLIAIGLFLGLYPQFDFGAMRIPGVLQRIGLCYFFASMIVLHSKRTGRIAWIVSLLLGYWALMTLIPFPGKGSNHWSLGGNFAQYIDNIILKGHLYKPDFDPEGLISTIPAIAQVLLGFCTGDWIRSNRNAPEKTVGLFIAANIFLFLGIIWNQWMPINKQLWTSSYVVYTTGIALHLFAIAYWLIDIKDYGKATRPFVVFGSNAIFVYSASSLMTSTLIGVFRFTLPDGTKASVWRIIFSGFFQPVFGGYFGSLIFAVVYVSIWLGIMSILYRKTIFIKI
jgi:predicted acyltransferase